MSQELENKLAALTLSDAEEERYQKIRSLGVECNNEQRLRELVKQNKQLLIIDGFEPSGRMTIAHGLLRAIQTQQLMQLNCKFAFIVGDWFAVMNNKLGGDLKKIQNISKYMIETWKAIPTLGAQFADESRAQFILSSEFINKNASNYWIQTLDVARRCSVENITDAKDLMGLIIPPAKKDEDVIGKSFMASQIFYPCMQLADLYFLQADIGHFGMDQKAIIPLLNAYATAASKDQPVVLLHSLLPGLNGKDKMSSSDPQNAIFMDDLENEVSTKIKKAFCAEKNVENNPILEIVKSILLPFDGKFEVARDEKNGGNKTYTTYEQVEADFKDGSLHPSDFKPAVSKALNAILNPIREHFKKNVQLKQLVDNIKKYK